MPRLISLGRLRRRLLKEAGFQSTRFNLHPFRHMDRERDWALRDSWFATLDWAVKEATAQGLMVILDFHEFDAMGKDAEGNREKFLAFWRQLSAHCANAGDNVVFEILNEPSKKLTPALWNQYLREALGGAEPHGVDSSLGTQESRADLRRPADDEDNLQPPSPRRAG